MTPPASRLGLADSDADIGSGELFPHEANLDQLGGVSFNKGCYIGQEVVSRMEHRGTARSRILPRDAFEAQHRPSGTEIRAGDKLVGTMLSSAGTRALAPHPPRPAGGGCSAAADRWLSRSGCRNPRWVSYEVPGAEASA